MGDIEFNFTVEQKEKYNLIMDETKKIYPKFFKDEIELHRIKVLIAYNVIFGDNIELERKREEIIIEEDNK
jgi:predicted O-methyltransferase YrrM